MSRIHDKDFCKCGAEKGVFADTCRACRDYTKPPTRKTHYDTPDWPKGWNLKAVEMLRVKI